MAPAAQASPALAAGWRGRRLDELPRITRETLLTREESLRLTKLKFDQGVSSALDLRLAESLTEGARVALALLARQRALDENTLTLLVGQPLPMDLVAALPVGLPLTGQGLLADAERMLFGARDRST